MAEHRNSFVLYNSLLEDVVRLTDKQAGALFRAILRFVNNEKAVVDDELSGLFEKIKKDIVFEWSKYNPKTGKYHWNYKGGITPANRSIRNSEATKIWRYEVFSRDKYTCQDCGVVGGILHAHHIKEFAKYPEFRFDVNNGLTLCKACHNKKHRKNG